MDNNFSIYEVADVNKITGNCGTKISFNPEEIQAELLKALLSEDRKLVQGLKKVSLSP